MVDKFEITVQKKDSGMRLDKFLIDNMDSHSRSFIQRLVQEAFISVNGKPSKKNFRVKEGDIIAVTIPKPRSPVVEAADIPLDIVYEDSWLLVVNKPAGMAVHPAPGNTAGTLVNALLYRYDNLPQCNGAARPGIVHRLDKDTTGLLVVAKNGEAYKSLVGQFKARSVNRRYIALVRGKIHENEGTIEAPIGRHRTNRKKMTVTAEGARYALSRFSVIRRYRGYTLVEIKLETGRTHQIRVHLQYIGHPIIGDTKYGRPDALGVTDLMLHAAVLGFIHPKKGEYIEFQLEMPRHFKKVLEQL